MFTLVEAVEPFTSCRACVRACACMTGIQVYMHRPGKLGIARIRYAVRNEFWGVVRETTA